MNSSRNHNLQHSMNQMVKIEQENNLNFLEVGEGQLSYQSDSGEYEYSCEQQQMKFEQDQLSQINNEQYENESNIVGDGEYQQENQDLSEYQFFDKAILGQRDKKMGQKIKNIHKLQQKKNRKNEKEILRRQKRSVVWKYFGVVQDSTNDPRIYTNQSGVCVKCGLKIPCKKNYSTLDMKKHLKINHPQLLSLDNQINNFPVKFQAHAQKKQLRNNVISNKTDIGGKNLINLTPYFVFDGTQNKKRNPYKSLEKQNNFELKCEQGYDPVSNLIPNQTIFGRPRKDCIWEIFVLDKQNSQIICQLCNYVMKRRKNRSNDPLYIHLEKQHSQIKWLLDKQTRQGLFQLRDRFQSLIRKKNKKQKSKLK